MSTTVEKLMNLGPHVLANVNEAEKSEGMNFAELLRGRLRTVRQRIDKVLLEE